MEDTISKQSTDLPLHGNSDSITECKRKLPGAWSFMSPPTKKDVVGNRKVSKAFDAPKKTFDFLIVLDFEWTCDKVKFGPSEIIEFPSVLLSGQFIIILSILYLMRSDLMISLQDYKL